MADSPTRPIVDEYAENNELWISEFGPVSPLLIFNCIIIVKLFPHFIAY